MSTRHPILPCQRVVELVTDYLEHALSIEDRNQLEQHLLICGPCLTFIEQHAAVARALAALREPARELPAEPRVNAVTAFRKLRGRGAP
jgi:hypothetical protein